MPSGDLLRVRMPAGRPVEDLEAAAETTAAFLEVREVRVARDPDNARYARWSWSGAIRWPSWRPCPGRT